MTCAAEEFPALVPSPRGSPSAAPAAARTRYLQGAAIVTASAWPGEDAHCAPHVPTINAADQANLWRVAFLGAHLRFLPPEALWLTGISPIDLRQQVALIKAPPGQNL